MAHTQLQSFCSLRQEEVDSILVLNVVRLKVSVALLNASYIVVHSRKNDEKMLFLVFRLT